MLVPMHIKKKISDLIHFSLSRGVKVNKRAGNVRGVTKIDGVVKSPASESCCVSETLAEFCFLIITAVNVCV